MTQETHPRKRTKQSPRGHLIIMASKAKKASIDDSLDSKVIKRGKKQSLDVVDLTDDMMTNEVIKREKNESLDVARLTDDMMINKVIKREKNESFDVVDLTDDVMTNELVIKREKNEAVSSDEDFYFNNPKWPVWSRETEGLSSNRLIEMILTSQGSNKICQHRPTSVRHNAVFVIDLEKVDIKDITADDNGSWDISSPRRKYHVDKDHETGNIKSIKRASEDGRNVYTLYRQYGSHKASKKENGIEYKRLLATLKDLDGNMAPIAVLQYFFKGGKEHDIVLAPHGNARGKNKRPYLRTASSTFKDIKESCFTKKPKVLYDEKFESNGGLLNSTTISSEPRNPKQIYNARADVTSKNKGEEKDEIFQLLMQLKDDYAADGGFIQEVTFGKTHEVIVAFEQQLNDVARFCTDPVHFSVMGIDPTFNLGKFFVTITTYKHLMLKLKRSHEHPIFVGPCFVHMLQTTQSYYGFLSYLIGKKPVLRDLKAYGSDGELPLLNALIAAFPEPTIGLRCFIHMKDNLEEALQKKFLVQPEVKTSIIKDIFGHKISDTKILGLVDSSSDQELDANLSSLKEKWERLAPGFFDWFKKKKADVLKHNMIAPIREAAQLGSPPKIFTTNANESKNFVLKDWVDFKKNTIPKFIEGLRGYTERCLTEAERSIYGAGEYCLSEEYKYLQVDPSEWHRKTEEERRAHIKRFREAKAKSPTQTPKPPSQSVPATPQQHSASSSIDSIPGIPAETLKGIWSKSQEIISKQDAVVQAPGNPEAMMVESKSGKRPHLVSKEKKGKFTCDDGCRMWLSTRLCAHTVAVAQKMDLLEDFVLWRKNTKAPTVCLTGVVLDDTPKGAGKKGGKAPSKKYGASSSSIATKHTYDPFKMSATQTTETSPFSDSTTSQLTPFEGTGFSLKWMTRRITVCQGKCGKPMRMPDGGIFPPPYDICIARKEQRSYYKNGHKHLGTWGDSHYHFKKACLSSNYDPRVPIKVNGDIQARWGKTHKDHLKSEFAQ